MVHCIPCTTSCTQPGANSTLGGKTNAHLWCVCAWLWKKLQHGKSCSAAWGKCLKNFKGAIRHKASFGGKDSACCCCCSCMVILWLSGSWFVVGCCCNDDNDGSADDGAVVGKESSVSCEYGFCFATPCFASDACRVDFLLTSLLGDNVEDKEDEDKDKDEDERHNSQGNKARTRRSTCRAMNRLLLLRLLLLDLVATSSSAAASWWLILYRERQVRIFTYVRLVWLVMSVLLLFSWSITWFWHQKKCD